MTPLSRSHRKQPAALTALIASGALFLSACSGSVGATTGSEDSGEGFAYNADQAEVDAVLENLSAQTITFQTAAPSPDSLTASPALYFKEEVEARSGGKLTVDIAWGMSVAGYREALNAIQDGRLDISYVLPPYDPQRFPEASEVGAALASIEYSPLQGELVGYAVGSAIGWNDDMFLDPFRDEGVTPLQPVVTSGAYSLNCTEPVVSISDITGKQVRIGTAPQADSAAHMGGVPTSMEFTETFEALQRGTVDCDLGPMAPKEMNGIWEAAPHLSYTTSVTWPRFAASYLAGSSFDALPLAYQQIIHDASALLLGGDAETYISANAAIVRNLNEAGGSVTEMDGPFQDELKDYLREVQNKAIDNGTLPEGILERVAALEEEWSVKVKDMGYADGGPMNEIDKWYDEDTDYREFSLAVHETGGALEHRPS